MDDRPLRDTFEMESIPEQEDTIAPVLFSHRRQPNCIMAAVPDACDPFAWAPKNKEKAFLSFVDSSFLNNVSFLKAMPVLQECKSEFRKKKHFYQLIV